MISSKDKTQLTAVVTGDPADFTIDKSEVREVLADAGMDVKAACTQLATSGPKHRYSRWTLSEESTEVVRKIALEMIEEMRAKVTSKG